MGGNLFKAVVVVFFFFFWKSDLTLFSTICFYLAAGLSSDRWLRRAVNLTRLCQGRFLLLGCIMEEAFGRLLVWSFSGRGLNNEPIGILVDYIL